VIIGKTSNDSFRYHFTESVNGKDNIAISLKAASIETGSQMGHDQIPGGNITRDNPVGVLLIKMKWPVVPCVQTACGDHGHTPI
jgi:hypothetical protein